MYENCYEHPTKVIFFPINKSNHRLQQLIYNSTSKTVLYKETMGTFHSLAILNDSKIYYRSKFLLNISNVKQTNKILV